ncbi:folate-binding protein YgfZ [Polynucleobacter sp. UK-Kesae-W10]|uniref:CAF17-like 4Fe-4S cluster assembly/insertion protein YgfZ n=1 Tax=Polynucleobacter sp. UK-Kesae-W10 TaxID=1819738 RepID=UPI001C0B51E0|nr:folate-binding protein [Polynucleobacter sp. UK-Kesae-W10]MBU3577960.1 folate-binding protein YgfZ [Polynucleobacter sp. UK-Kesae-W10]
MTTTSQNTTIQGQIPSSGLSLLPQWGIIFVEGPDAASFLQNQLSNSVLGLDRIFPPKIAAGHSCTRLVGYCNPKGRLLASAWLALAPNNPDGEDRFVLFISKDIAESTAKRLSMYVLRSKVKVCNASSQWSISGQFDLSQKIDPIAVADGQIALRLPDVLANGQSIGRLLLAQENTGQVPAEDVLSLKVFNNLEVLSAIPRIVLQTQEQFVPQMINFESVAGVDFKKGCYPGQEIVARSQYRGAIKRRLFLAHYVHENQDSSPIVPGTELFHDLDPSQPAGMVVLSAPCPHLLGRINLQIECKLEALEAGNIHLGSSQGPVLQMDALPYPLIEI